MVVTLTKERKSELTALGIMACWVIAWINNAYFGGPDIPLVLNLTTPAAAGLLLGKSLPIDIKRKEPNGNGKT